MSAFPILGIDPGFASIGYAVVLVEGAEKYTPIKMGLIRTDKSDAKRSVFASEDNVRRAGEIYRELKKLLLKGQHGVVKAICAETMSFPRSSSVAAKMAMCWGVLAALSVELDIPILQATPQGLKKLVAGSKKASKEDIQFVLNTVFGKEALEQLVGEVPPSMLEHPFDALGAVVACRDSEVLRLARRMSA